MECAKKTEARCCLLQRRATERVVVGIGPPETIAERERAHTPLRKLVFLGRPSPEHLGVTLDPDRLQTVGQAHGYSAIFERYDRHTVGAAAVHEFAFVEQLRGLSRTHDLGLRAVEGAAYGRSPTLAGFVVQLLGAAGQLHDSISPVSGSIPASYGSPSV